MGGLQSSSRNQGKNSPPTSFFLSFPTPYLSAILNMSHKSYPTHEMYKSASVRSKRGKDPIMNETRTPVIISEIPIMSRRRPVVMCPSSLWGNPPQNPLSHR